MESNGPRVAIATLQILNNNHDNFIERLFLFDSVHNDHFDGARLIFTTRGSGVSKFPINYLTVNVVAVVLSWIVSACAPVAFTMAFLMPSSVVAGADAVVGWAQTLDTATAALAMMATYVDRLNMVFRPKETAAAASPRLQLDIRADHSD